MKGLTGVAASAISQQELRKQFRAGRCLYEDISVKNSRWQSLRNLNAAVLVFQEFGQWGWADLWDSMGWLARALVVMLAVMLAHVLVIVNERQIRFAIIRAQSRRFVSAAKSLFDTNRVHDAVSCAAKYPHSHLARMTLAALAGFLSCPPSATDGEAIEAMRRAAKRARLEIDSRLKAGVPTLAVIAGTAPFVGLFGTVIGILNSFRGWGAPKAYILAWTVQSLSESLAPTGISLVVAILATWSQGCLLDWIALFEVEMINASSELETYLSVNIRLRDSFEFEDTRTGLLNSQAQKRPSWEINYDYQTILLVAHGLFAFYIVWILASATVQSLPAHLGQ